MKSENRKEQTGILTVKAAADDTRIQKMSAEHFLAYINQVLAELIPAVKRQEGRIDTWQGAGLIAFYEKEPEQALRTALEICRRCQGSYAMGISYGMILRGTVGYGEHKWTVSLSEDKKISASLQSLAARYAVPVLVTASYADQITDFSKRYIHRLLGEVYLENSRKTEIIYEVFEGEDKERIFLKQKTRMVFEEGIHLFQAGKPERARKHFIEVLKIHREDQVARDYLRRCDDSHQTGKEKGEEESCG